MDTIIKKKIHARTSPTKQTNKCWCTFAFIISITHLWTLLHQKIRYVVKYMRTHVLIHFHLLFNSSIHHFPLLLSSFRLHRLPFHSASPFLPFSIGSHLRQHHPFLRLSALASLYHARGHQCNKFVWLRALNQTRFIARIGETATAWLPELSSSKKKNNTRSGAQ